jgi:hypothetical protein
MPIRPTIGADEPQVAKGARGERGQNRSVKPGIMKWIFRLLLLIGLALGYMGLKSAEGLGRLLFVCYNLALLLLWGLQELQHFLLPSRDKKTNFESDVLLLRFSSNEDE